MGNGLREMHRGLLPFLDSARGLSETLAGQKLTSKCYAAVP